MLSKPKTLFLLFILFLGFYSIYENINSFSWDSFLLGFICGLPIASCWLKNKWVGPFLLSISVLGLIFTQIYDLYEPDRLLFSGSLFGVLVGFLPAYHLNKPLSILLARNWFKADGYMKLANYFQIQLDKYRK